MSAVIWFGIVAVWAFVLIPTWVRRSDIHWRSSGHVDGSTRDRLARATRVVSRSGSQVSRRRPVARPVEVPSPRVMAEARVEAPSEARESQSPESAAPESAARESAAREAVESESPMTNPRPARPAPRRSPAPSLTGARQAPPPRVQRARRLVWIGAVALATLLLAMVAGGWWIMLNLAADAALVAYLRHLRGIAREEQAQRRNRTTARRTPVAAPTYSPTTARHRPETVSVAEPEMIDLTDDCPTTELTRAV